MIANNKIISLTIIGLVIGVVLFLLTGGGAGGTFVLVPFGGIVGFLAGWVWKSRSEKSEA